MKKAVVILALIACAACPSFAESYVVKSGDTLSGILSDRYGARDIKEISSKIKEAMPGFVLKSGTKMYLYRSKAVLNVSLDKDLIITSLPDGSISVELETHPKEIMTVLVKGEIKSNLFDAVKKAGEDPELAVMIAAIFEWEIDFFKDLRPGDKFAVLVEKKFVNNKYAGYGRITAADFYNKGRLNRAVYYEDGKNRGYFNEEGRALERGFLRVPLSYARITSRFTTSRFHPVLGKYRPHYGVDYAAPAGTPVMATASGTVETIGRTKANGNYVALRHSNGYKTYYLHLRGFNKALRKGSSVTQGQIIGYVGSTGYSTGPHLDYRINHNGKWLNPLTFVATPKSLKKEDLEKFTIYAENSAKILDRAFAAYASLARPNDVRMLEF